MLRKLGLIVTFSCFAGASATAAAVDLGPPRPAAPPTNSTSTEGEDAPAEAGADEKDEEDSPPAEAAEAGEDAKTEPPAEAQPPAGDDKADAKIAPPRDDKKDGLCSIGGPETGLMGLASAIVLLSGLALRRRC